MNILKLHQLCSLLSETLDAKAPPVLTSFQMETAQEEDEVPVAYPVTNMVKDIEAGDPPPETHLKPVTIRLAHHKCVRQELTTRDIDEILTAPKKRRVQFCSNVVSLVEAVTKSVWRHVTYAVERPEVRPANCLDATEGASERLTANRAPSQNRRCVVDPLTYAELLGNRFFIDATGDDGTTRMLGMEWSEDQLVERPVIFHRDAIVVATRFPEVTSGVLHYPIVDSRRIAIMVTVKPEDFGWLFEFSCLWGVKVVNPDHIELI